MGGLGLNGRQERGQVQGRGKGGRSWGRGVGIKITEEWEIRGQVVDMVEQEARTQESGVGA